MNKLILPEDFKRQIKALLKDEYESYIKSLDQPPYMGVRVNTLKISPNGLKKIYDSTLEPVNWCDNGFYYQPEKRPAKSPLYAAGLYYIQEPSAMSPAAVIDISPGHKVLDMCAAPGGKSTQAGARLNGSGVIVANDVSASRCGALLKNMELWGIRNFVVTNESPERLASKFSHFFDRILVDAPCSGEGMFRKDPSSIKSWAKHKSNECVVLQRNILYHAAKMLAPGGRIMYSTCTFSPDENERMIESFLNQNPNFELIPIDCAKYGFDFGRIELVNDKRIAGCARLWPHKLKGEGHFLAYIKKSEETFEKSAEYKPVAVKDIEYFYDFCSKYLINGLKTVSENTDLFELHGKSLFLRPPGLPDLKGIRIKRCGFYLGDIKTKRFEPSQAFAMGIKMSDAKNNINFEQYSQYIQKYLKGESFEIDCTDGWNLVGVSGFPVGWAKASNAWLKNKYFKGWVMR